MPGSERYHAIRKRARELRLSTVCEEARCPNIGECWGGGTATFMVMGDTCTRGCRFCAVKTAKYPGALDADEPLHVAEAIREMDLDYVVITSVDRDDLPDGGASHFAAVIRQTRTASPKTKVEVLIPDFGGDVGSLLTLMMAEPDVVAHNQETVKRLTHPVRDRKASYETTLEVLRNAKRMDPNRFTKSSLMVGLGETEDEMRQAMQDLRDVGVDFLTIGQYLQPTPKHLAVEAFVHPDQFAAYEQMGLEMGYRYVASGPLVRSSYKAGEFFIRRALDEQAEPTEG
ncbi:MAG: lipoyl synthase [Myxococcales bacterium]|nr:lipoyl synthase [Myxococcales bacterium]